jgi:hypothetical protein
MLQAPRNSFCCLSLRAAVLSLSTNLETQNFIPKCCMQAMHMQSGGTMFCSEIRECVTGWMWFGFQSGSGMEVIFPGVTFLVEARV